MRVTRREKLMLIGNLVSIYLVSEDMAVAYVEGRL
jgi:hypothetical protein